MELQHHPPPAPHCPLTVTTTAAAAHPGIQATSEYERRKEEAFLAPSPVRRGILEKSGRVNAAEGPASDTSRSAEAAAWRCEQRPTERKGIKLSGGRYMGDLPLVPGQGPELISLDYPPKI